MSNELIGVRMGRAAHRAIKALSAKAGLSIGEYYMLMGEHFLGMDDSIRAEIEAAALKKRG